jgi:hypothetical protein
MFCGYQLVLLALLSMVHASNGKSYEIVQTLEEWTIMSQQGLLGRRAFRSTMDCSWTDQGDHLPPEDQRPSFVKEIAWQGCDQVGEKCSLSVTFLDDGETEGESLSSEFLSSTLDFLAQLWECVQGASDGEGHGKSSQQAPNKDASLGTGGMEDSDGGAGDEGDHPGTRQCCWPGCCPCCYSDNHGYPYTSGPGMTKA